MQRERQQPKYQDVYDDTSFAEAASSDKESSLSFPQQLMEALSDERLSDIVSWLPHGQGWIIHDKKRFAVEVLPVYFEKKSKWTSFTRKLNRWNFTRVTRGDEVGAYYHPLFKRENKELCLQMTCLGSKMTQNLEPLNPVALGLATPKMIEHGLLSGMAPRGGFMKSTAKKKAAIPSQQQSMILSPSSAASAAPLSPSFYFQSQLTDQRSTPFAPSTSTSLQLNPPPVHNFPNISVPPSTTQATPGYPDRQQQVFLGAIGNPLTSSTYGGMVLPELRNAPPWTNARRPPSPNPLPFGNDMTPFLQQTPVPAFSSWTQLPPTTTGPLFATNHAAQPSFPAASALQQPAQQQHQNMVAYFDQFNQRIHAASQQEDTLTLTPTPALSHSSIVETPSQQTSRHLAHLPQQDSTAGGHHEALSPDHSGQDISPSIFDTTSSSSDQGSGVVHAGRPRGSSSSPEETGNKMMLTSRIMMPTVRTSGAMPQQQQPGSRGDGGGSSNIVRSLPGGSVVAMHQSQNNIVSGDQKPGGGIMSSLSLTEHASAVVGTSSKDRILASLLDQTRKDFHDLLQQQQQQQGGEEPLISPATMHSIIRGNQQDPSFPEGTQK